MSTEGMHSELTRNAMPFVSCHANVAATASVKTNIYRADGVRITHDAHAPEMVGKYGAPGKTDSEGFDPYADTVGPGIYGGIVERESKTGEIVIGRQYQNHNTRPGPVYAGGGYTKVVQALKSPDGLFTLQFSHRINVHMCLSIFVFLLLKSLVDQPSQNHVPKIK